MAEFDRVRWLSARLNVVDRPLVAQTGARQTGKTTLAKAAFPAPVYPNLNDLGLWRTLRDLPASRCKGASPPI